MSDIPAIFCSPGGAGARWKTKIFLKKNLGKFIMKNSNFLGQHLTGNAHIYFLSDFLFCTKYKKYDQKRRNLTGRFF
jgi:hypothetical protein